MDHIHTEKSESAAAVDPVCGMKVDTATAKFRAQHDGKEYFFCSAGCLAKFQSSPETILSSLPKPMGPGVVSLGTGPGMASAPVKSAATSDGAGKSAALAYVCPMCAEVKRAGPGPCPKCGMALEPESPVLPATKTEWTCPMHPEIVRPGPGSCPICGMTLEPRTVTSAEEENPELRDMTRRFT